MISLFRFINLFLWVFVIQQIHAQHLWWNIGPSDVSIHSLGALDPYIFAGAPCNEGGMFLTMDEGENWDTVNSGLPGDPSIISSIAISDSSILVAAGFRGMFISTDTARTWTHVVHNGSLQSIHTIVFADSPWNAIVTGGSRLKNIAGMMISENGTTWIDINAGLPLAGTILSLLVRDSSIYAGTLNGVFKLNFYTNHWEPSNAGMTNSPIISLGQNDSYLFAGSDNDGVFRSSDGEHWIQVNTGLSIVNNEFTSFAFYGPSIFVSEAGELGGVYQTTDNGDHWYGNNVGFHLNTVINALTISEPYIYAGAGDGVFRRLLSSITSADEIPDEELNIRCIIYPNPGTGKFTLSINSDNATGEEIKDVDVICHTPSGQVIFSKHYKVENDHLKTEFDLSAFVVGIYFIQIRNQDRSVFKKLVISH